MTNGEQKALWRGVAAGTIMGLAIGLMITLLIAMKPTVGAVAAFVTALAIPAFLTFFAINGSRTNTGA